MKKAICAEKKKKNASCSLAKDTSILGYYSNYYKLDPQVWPPTLTSLVYYNIRDVKVLTPHFV